MEKAQQGYQNLISHILFLLLTQPLARKFQYAFHLLTSKIINLVKTPDANSECYWRFFSPDTSDDFFSQEGKIAEQINQ